MQQRRHKNPPQRGISRIEAAFKEGKRNRSAALMPYFPFGYPDLETSMAVIESVSSYSDILELGIPFSDPLADGPTIQKSTQISLEKGTTTASCLEMLSQMRKRGMDTPVMFMGYYNPILAYGEEAFVRDAAEAGADGFIVPDLPPEEAENLERLAAEAGLALVHFLAPTSNPSRINNVVARARGFIYLVSLTGVTGARNHMVDDLDVFVERVRTRTPIPLAVGFGISTPEQAASVGRIADGVIIGSALINAVDAAEDKPAAAAQYLRSISKALES